MIAKIISGSSFHFSYLDNKVDKEKGYLLDSNFIAPQLNKTENSYNIKKLYRDTIFNNPNVRSFDSNMFHVSLSLNSFENLSNEQFLKLGYEYLEKIGLDNNRPIEIFRHTDTDKPHIHILTTKIDYNGVKMKEKNIRYKSMKISRELELKYNLALTEYDKGERKTFNEIHAKKRDPKINLDKDIIKQNVDHFSKISNDFDDFKKHLQENNINVFQLSGTKGIKLVYNYKEFYVKDAKLGRNYNYYSISSKTSGKLMFSEKEQKQFLAKNINACLKGTDNYNTFKDRLNKRNIEVTEHNNKSGVFGLSFKSTLIDNAIEFKGSQLDYSYKDIIDKIEDNTKIKGENFEYKDYENIKTFENDTYIDQNYFKPIKASKEQDDDTPLKKKKKKNIKI